MIDMAHNGLVALAILSGCLLLVSFAQMDRYAMIDQREQFNIGRVYFARQRLSRWSWAALYSSVVMAGALLALLIGA